MGKPLIMVVDDEKQVADEIADTIRRTNKYKAIAAYSGKEALEYLSKNKTFFGLGSNRIKLIFVDIKMPGMDGLELLSKIRRQYGEGIGISMLTAYEDEEKWERATDAFVINYIKKPFKDEEVISTIDRFFEGKEARMVLDTFERHIEKQEEWRKGKKETK